MKWTPHEGVKTVRGLKDKVIIAAGAATGIGAATAKRLGEEGAKIVVGDLNLEGAEATASAIREAGGDAVALPYNQGDWESVSSFISAAKDHYGRIDGLFPNAIDGRAVLADTDLLTIELGVWDAMLRVGVTGYFYLIRAALPSMLEAGRGVIVCTSSDASTIGEINRPAYGVAKAGVNALVRHVATRYGHEGIRINAIRPFALTPPILANLPKELVDSWTEQNRSGRIGSPEEAASVVAFLMSDDASYVNGQILSVNGGMVFNP